VVTFTTVWFSLVVHQLRFLESRCKSSFPDSPNAQYPWVTTTTYPNRLDRSYRWFIPFYSFCCSWKIILFLLQALQKRRLSFWWPKIFTLRVTSCELRTDCGSSFHDAPADDWTSPRVREGEDFIPWTKKLWIPGASWVVSKQILIAVFIYYISM
jgi:hypothetical protein